MAQLKSTVVQGNLTASGQITATKLIKNGGSSTDILMADGSTENIDELSYIPLTGSPNVTGDITSSAKITAIEFDGPATSLKTGRTLKVNLASTSASTAFDGTANISNIGVSGTLAVANGGTGKTTGRDAANYFLNELTTGSDIPRDDDYFISQYANGGTAHTSFHRRPVKYLYSYIEDKADDRYVQLGGSNNITGELISTASITATKFIGPLNGTADKATQDADGNTISSTYLKLTGGHLTGALGASKYLIKPVADYRTKTKDHTGMITITLPANINHTMVSMWIDVYDYKAAHKSFSVHVGGYTYTYTDSATQLPVHTWANKPFAVVYGAEHSVRLGHNGTNFVIYIGEKATKWEYPQVSVRDVIVGYNGTMDKWDDAWTISFTQTEPSNVTATINHYAWTTKNLNPNNYIPLAGSNKITGELISSTSITAAGGFIGNASTASALLMSKVNGNPVAVGSKYTPVYFTADGTPAATVWTFGDSGNAVNCEDVTYNFSGYFKSENAYPGKKENTDLGFTSAHDGALWSQAYSTSWVGQIAQDYRNGALFARGRNNNSWSAWRAILDSNNFDTFLESTYVHVDGDTMTGDLYMGSNSLYTAHLVITDGTNSKATYQYNAANDCVELVFN